MPHLGIERVGAGHHVPVVIGAGLRDPGERTSARASSSSTRPSASEHCNSWRPAHGEPVIYREGCVSTKFLLLDSELTSRCLPRCGITFKFANLGFRGAPAQPAALAQQHSQAGLSTTTHPSPTTLQTPSRGRGFRCSRCPMERPASTSRRGGLWRPCLAVPIPVRPNPIGYCSPSPGGLAASRAPPRPRGPARPAGR